MRLIALFLSITGLLCSAENQGQAPAVLDIQAGAYANAHLLSNLELQAGKSAEVVIVADIEQVASDGKKVVYKNVRFFGTATQAKVGDRIDIKLSKAAYKADNGQSVEAKAVGLISNDNDGTAGVIPGAKKLPDPSNAAAVVNAVGPVISVTNDQSFTLIISNQIKA